jgi:hypothetical protein
MLNIVLKVTADGKVAVRFENQAGDEVVTWSLQGAKLFADQLDRQIKKAEQIEASE